MAQLCLWTKIRTKHCLMLGASAFQCMPAGFLCPKCNNFACLRACQDQNELHLKRWFFFWPKSASSGSRSQAHLAKHCSIVYTTIFVRRKDKTNYLSNQLWAKCYHSRNKHWLKKKTLDGRPCIWKTQQTKVLTYLIGNNNSINGFRPAATHPYRRLCFLHAYASFLHQSMTGLRRFGLSNGCKVVLFADSRRSPHTPQIPVSPEHPP